ncbi:hypothetical protein Pmani_004037 [Petrolisthes manimaculis]|uniref:Uncharacterized protein n=1 Tax=Petrolisthes manimaculis TaxID=1843537 RepID=A0AAE1QEG5_9EUCA|nr:hypothetical protein Pmani_004037 [Petrolisthes manimaculis]
MSDTSEADTDSSHSTNSNEGDGKVRKGSTKSKFGSRPSAKKPRREQRYRKAWEKQFQWIKSSKKDAHKAMCGKCDVEMSAQITTLKLHQKSEKHKKNCGPSTSRTIVEAFAGTSSTQHNKSDAIKNAEIKLVAMMMEHNMSFRTADHMADVLKDFSLIQT